MRKQDARRTKGSGSLFKRKGRFVYQWRLADGTKKTKVLTNERGDAITTYLEAVKAASILSQDHVEVQRITTKLEYLTELAEAKKIISCSHTTIAVMWDEYLKSPNRPDSSTGTLDFYHDAVLPFQKWMAARHREVDQIRDITEEMACEYATEFWRSGVSERTYNARITSLRMVLRVLLKDGTPFDAIRRKTPRPQSRNAFTAAQLKAISDTINDPDYYMLHKPEMRLMLLIMLYTGCRGEDAALLKWSYIDFDNRTITYIPIKTARKRPVPVTVPIASCLYEALHGKEHDDPIYVLPKVANRYRHNPCGISTDITKLLEASGIKTKVVDPDLQRKRPIVLYSMHSFRHTFCSIAVNAGIPLATIQAIVGHSTSDMTAHYSHISMESKKEAVSALESAAHSSALSTDNAMNVPEYTCIADRFSKLSKDQNSLIAKWLETHLSPNQKRELNAVLEEFSCNAIRDKPV